MSFQVKILFFLFIQVWFISTKSNAQYAIIQDIRLGSSGSNPSDFAIFNGVLYFGANDGNSGKELWKYDGTNAPTMVADIRPGSSGAAPSNLMTFNNRLYFTANNGTNGTELWEYDGVNTPSMVADIAPGPGNGVRYKPVEYNGKLYFEGLNFTNYFALWEYDGVNAPTMVSDIHSGVGSGLSNFLVFDGKLYFAADDEVVGFELWSYDGATTDLVHDINPGGGATPTGLYVFNNKLYFDATDGTNGFELWAYDGNNTPAMVANISPGSGNASPKHLMEFEGKLYFNATNGTNGQELWEYDGINTPVQVADINPGGANSTPDNLIVYNDKLYFSANDGSTGIELWSYDGTNAPAIVDDLYTGALSGKPDDMIIFDGKLVMEASNGSNGFELWSYSAPNGCSCSAASPIPTDAGTYTSSCSATDGAWKHFCDSSGNLLLSLNIGNSGAVVNDNEVSLKIGSVPVSYFPYQCASSPPCFVDLPGGVVTFNRSWDVNPTTQPSSGNVGVQFYFSQAEYNAVNTEINNQGQAQLTDMNQMWFYKVINAGLGQFPTVAEIVPEDVQVITNDASTPAADKWVLSTKSAGSEYVAQFDVTSFSGGGGGGAGGGLAPLPVELLYFDVDQEEADVKISWATASEMNNDRFEIYKSSDGENWNLFEIVGGRGNANDIHEYAVVDTKPSLGINYYKIVQVDYDGRTASLGIRAIDLSRNGLNQLKVFPNPVKDVLNIFDAEGEAFIYNCSGYLVQQAMIYAGMRSIDVSGLQDGMYQILIISETGQRITTRFVK